MNSKLRAKLTEILRFSIVGGLAFVVDIGVYNILRFGPNELMSESPLKAKIISVAVATFVSWLGNRFWTFSTDRTQNHLREFITFGVINVIGLLIGVGTIAFSHYLLDFTSPIADNVSNIIGIGLGTIFRYFAYRYWVFTGGEKIPKGKSVPREKSFSS